MYHFYGIIDRSAHRHEGDHRQSIATIRKKFPARSTGFDLLQRERLTVFGSHIRSARIGVTELFICGEIFNEDDIRSAARSAAPQETVLLELFLREGVSALSRINGSFMIIILEHDSGRRRIINDQMGTRQVFYYAADDFIVFGSELKFLFCHSLCPRNIDWTASLKRHIPFLIINAERQYEAWFKDIKLLEEGSILELPPSGPHTVFPYWNPWQTISSPLNGIGQQSEDRQVDMYCEAYMALLDDAVRIRSASPGSTFSMFSGGMDSTIIAALARKYGRVDTFSFATQATVRDGATDMCIRLAEDLDVANTQVIIPFDQLVNDGQLWTKHIWAMESPLGHKDAIGKMTLHAAISAVQPDARHIMSGTGSDQLNGGLVRWFAAQDDDTNEHDNWGRVMDEIRSEMLKPVVGHQYDTFWGSRDLLSNDFLSSIGQAPIDDYPWAAFIRGCLHANQFVLVSDELRAGDWHHRGVRFPFMDHRFVPFMLSVPRDLHHKLFYDKQILRRGAQSMLPNYLTQRPKAPVIKPGEDRRMNMYHEILFGKNGLVFDQLMEMISSNDIPVDRMRFEAKAHKLSEQPDQAGWAYLMHVAGLVMLGQLPDQDEKSLDMHDHIMPRVTVLPSSVSAVMDHIHQHLSLPTAAEKILLPLSFAPQCSLVNDVFSNAYFLARDGEMVYQLDEDRDDWLTFLRSIDNARSANAICTDAGLDLASIEDFLRTSFEEGILNTSSTPVHHA